MFLRRDSDSPAAQASLRLPAASALRPARLVVVGLSLLAVATVACSADADADPVGSNGVNDVSQACAIRAQWTRPNSTDCNECIGIASVAKCDCTAIKDYAGLCSTQQNAKNEEPTCAGVGECVFKCDASDCACVEACYSGKEVCRERASALDGCLADVCDTYCR
ncbi:MAG: hypothetical protein KIS78_09350 [Labilithrix sp.]|nr:hypothetical protein [Labilithrix sp.]